MRLSESEIIAGLQHPSVFVRQIVAEYLKDCGRTQADVTRQLIAAVELFGWQEVLQFPHRVTSFELDETSLTWAIAQIERKDANAPSENIRWQLAGMLADAPIAVVTPQLAPILNLEAMHGRRARVGRSRTNAELLELRNNVWNQSPEVCWRRLEEHCHEVANVDAFEDADIPFAQALLERMAADEQEAAASALEILERAARPNVEFNPWLVGLMINLAGRLRLEPAAELIYRRFAEDWDWYNEQIMYALKKIGTSATTALVSAKYIDSPEHVRIYSAGILEAVHHDNSVADILKLLPYEDDEFHRGQLGVAMASHFDERGIQPAVELYREEPDDLERFAIIERLYAHALLAELDIPEMEQWKEWIESDWERFNKGRGLMDSFAEALLQRRDDWSDKEWFQDDDTPGNAPAGLVASHDEYGPFPKPQPIVREATRVGRNERCPCGSGKKYKNCCLRSELE